MGLLSSITDLVFGKAEAPEADFDEILKLLETQDRFNNPNIRGLFGGWEQQIGPDGRLVQTQTINPAMQPGLDAFIGRFNEGTADPQLEALKNARFEAMMNQRGPRPMPERRERPLNRSQYTDEEGNSIAPPDWWRRDKGAMGLGTSIYDLIGRR